ncbi:MAG: hypothetical protein JXA06_03555 [Bacteroidetes bacterium]|nr:hypothetical protein [Bacteroidota bacterium]
MKFLCIFLITLIAPFSSLMGQDNSLESQTKAGSPFSQSKFVPDISMIVDFSWVSRDMNNNVFSELHMPGLTRHHNEESQDHSSMNSRKGFNLNYGEISFYSIVDPYFDLFAVLHVAEEHAGLEEAYITTRKLPYGFQLKAGKFLSSFGRLNEQHTHYLDFAERPLVLNAFFGEEGLNELGARMTWVAPTDIYLMLGTEILMGENKASFGTSGFHDVNRIVNIHESENPGLIVGYARSSFDIEEAVVLFGLSYAHGKTRMDDDYSAAAGEGTAIDASTDILCGDLTVKYIIDAIQYISFQSEYIYRLTDGSLYSRDTSFTVERYSLEKKQSGFYSQLIAKLGLRWRAGVRYDLLNLNDVFIGSTSQNFPDNPDRYSAMVEYLPTEFSRLRLQLNHDRSKYLQTSSGLIYKPYTELILQLNIAIGAHGAHSF